MTPEQERALALSRARRRRAEAEGGQAQQSVPQQASGEPQIVGGVIMPPPMQPDGSWAGAVPSSSVGTLDERIGGALEQIRQPINAVNQAFTNMYMLGGMDELQGAADAVFSGKGYGESVDAVRQDLRQQGEDYPILTGAAGLAGAITSPATQFAMKAFPAAANIKTQIGAGALSGGVIGGAQGFMDGEGGPMNRLGAMVQGGALGAGFGAAIPGMAHGAGAAYRGVRNALADNRAVGQIADQLGISRRGANLVSNAVAMDDPVRMRAALGSSGKEAMLADAGPSMNGIMDAAIQSPGEGARKALGRIDARAEAAGTRLRSELDKALTGNNVGAQSTRQFSDTALMQGDLRQATAGARKAVYDKAYSQPIDYASEAGQALEGLLPRVPGKAIADANRLMQIDGHTSKQILATIGDDGAASFQKMPDVRQWDYIKRALDQAASTGEGQGAMGGQTPLGNAYQSLSRTIRRNLGEAVEDYNYATKVAGDVIGQVQAIQTGAEMLRPNVTRAALEASIDGMSQAEIGAVKRGLRQQIDDTLANVRAVATDPNVDAREAYKAYTALTSRSAQDKMKLLLGKDWKPVQNALADAASALGLRARVATNSRTFSRQQFGQMIEDSVSPGSIRRGEIVKSAKGLWQSVTGATPAAGQRMRAGVRNELADVLTRPGAMNALAGIEKIRGANLPSATAGKAAARVMNALGLSSLPATLPEARNRLLR